MYRTEETVAYQLHKGVYSHYSPKDLLTDAQISEIMLNLENISQIIHNCAEGYVERELQEGSARIEVRVPLSVAHQ